MVVIECCCCITYPTCADAGPDLCTFCPDFCTLRTDLCTLSLWCYPSVNQRKYSTCTHGGGHCLQLALVAFFLQPLAQTLLVPVVVSPLATCAGGLFSSTHWRIYSACARATCTVWWYIYIYIYIYIRLHLHTWWFHPLQLAPVMFSLTPTGTDTKLTLGQLAQCGGVFWVVVVDANVYVVAVVVAMGCWCSENVLVLVKENIS